MNQQMTTIKRALISVSNKTGIVALASLLAQLEIEIISTGGTSLLLKQAGLAVREVSDITGFPEMMDGRIKTLHPKIHGGILGQRDQHAHIAQEQKIDWIDLVIVNLYAFADAIKNPELSLDEAIEHIDIGGPTLIRAAAKNMAWATVVVDPADYELLASELKQNKGISLTSRQKLATKAFAHTADYDALVHRYLVDNPAHSTADQLQLNFKKHGDLRYGENPHQSACAYQLEPPTPGILSARQLQGKPLSYNNIADADAAWACVQEFREAACVIVKHANPCGVAVAAEIDFAYQQAFAADPHSAFGGIVALNRPCTTLIAEALMQVFTEVVIAPDYCEKALSILAKKPNLRLLALDSSQATTSPKELKFIQGGLLLQERNNSILEEEQLKIVTTAHPEKNELTAMLFAWRVLKHLKSNAILLAKDGATVGVGVGQVSRIDAVDLALRKAGKNIEGSILASDAFFAFRDSIDRIADFCKASTARVSAIIQPGGSIKDEEVIAACNEHGIAMVFTGQRCFKH